LYWLRYLRAGETRVVIMDGWSVAHARMRAAGLEPGVYASGCRIDRAAAAHIPESAVGRVLTRQEALRLLTPKKTAAPSLVPRLHD
jgi:hypothetical protein